ncbi:AI-2E family transporter (plasmid) [Caballeronia sp. NK8]|uniref:AI-2E family transporter n=1 Tax=Caballeronia sp. NK8 TaxID=140098 RepID=UPI001BB668CD|nr:AI-2E family transporter [Caballeronia sp. NK8]BCQ28945.1 AI-2E family transporter [Caballeronia sp. NK8]
MKERTSASNASWLAPIVILALGALLVRPFIARVLWAFILAYATWPLYMVIRKGLRGGASLSALMMTVSVALVIAGLTIAIAVPLAREVAELANRLVAWSGGEPKRLASVVADLPVVGAKLSELIREAPALRKDLAFPGDEWLSVMSKAGRNALLFGFTFIALYFTYRHGESLIVKVRGVLEPLIGPRLDAYVVAFRSVTRAVLIGVPVTAVGQAACAGVGYWAAGVDEPLLLTLLTALAALVPFGALLVWLPTGVALLMDANPWGGIGLLLWGALAVSSIDNVIRMVVIVNAVRMLFAIALLSIIGGVAAFGLIGLFAGPLVAEMLRILWDERIHAAQNDGTRSEVDLTKSMSRRSLHLDQHRPTSAARAMMRLGARRCRDPVRERPAPTHRAM